MLDFDDSMARKMFNRTNMDYCLADEPSKGVYDYVKLKIKDTLARNMFKRSNLNYCV
jgi:hypothetical protein